MGDRPLKKCLVIGASGQVGGQLLALCRARGCDGVGTACRNPRPGLAHLDLRDGAAIDRLLDAQRPDVVYLPGALTHVDYGEAHREECYAINVDGTCRVAHWLRRRGGCLVFFSTEHVFSDSPTSYTEDAPTAPRSVYAQSKVAAEEQLRVLLPERHLILRTSWVFGPDEQRKNFVYRAAATLDRGEELVVPEDQHGQPTFAPDLAATALLLVERGLAGTFHVVGPELLTRLAFARLIARLFGLDAGLIRGRPTAALNQPAPRPLHIRLDRTKLQQTLGCDPIRSPAAGLRALQEEVAGTSPRLRSSA